jgi:hypothetical protein
VVVVLVVEVEDTRSMFIDGFVLVLLEDFERGRRDLKNIVMVMVVLWMEVGRVCIAIAILQNGDDCTPLFLRDSRLPLSCTFVLAAQSTFQSPGQGYPSPGIQKYNLQGYTEALRLRLNKVAMQRARKISTK